MEYIGITILFLYKLASLISSSLAKFGLNRIGHSIVHIVIYKAINRYGSRHEVSHGKITQLDWTSCADTQKNHLPRDQEGYGGFEYTDEKLLTRRIHCWWWRATIIIFFFGELFLNNRRNIP